jgi:hypothetical protein
MLTVMVLAEAEVRRRVGAVEVVEVMAVRAEMGIIAHISRDPVRPYVMTPSQGL